MNKGPQEDPLGPPNPQESSSEQRAESPDLKDQLEHQQVVIAQFKEMLQKTDQSSVMQEKVDRYASTLSKMTIRAKKSKLKKESSSGSGEKSASKSGTGAPVNEKISLLRRQLEENKAKLAERGKSQKDIEEMVHQLKAQFDDSLQQIHDTSSNFSILEPKMDYNKNSSSEELYNILINKEKKITDLHSKVQKLETMVLDLQENVKEKDCVIDARTKAITLMSESLSKKSKNTQEALDETKQQMRKMQEEFIKLENEMKARQMKLLDDLRQKNLEIAELHEIIENQSNQDISISSDDPSKGDLNNQIKELLQKIEDLEALNTNLSKENEELKESSGSTEDFKQQLEELKEGNKTALEEKQKDITKLEKIIETLKLDISKQSPAVDEDKQVDETDKLRKELDELNKNMIKVEAEHNKKIKLLNEKIDGFKKIGDLNAQVVKLSEENDRLNERIAEHDEEMVNYQLNLIDQFHEFNENQSNRDISILSGDPSKGDLNNQIKELLQKIEDLEALNTNLSKVNEELKESSGSTEDFKQQLEELKESNKTALEEKQKDITKLEKIIETLKLDISKQSPAVDKVKQVDETGKLRKELDELNKNMIKVKAEHKKKIKLLNKKIDSFKKIGDLNAQVVKLSEENDGLNERIAELEEEKGNYQLKLIDEQSSRGSNAEELEEKLRQLSETLQEKSKEVEGLLSDKTSLEKQIETLNESLQEFSDSHNKKVTSEMTCIQYEEKLQTEMEELVAAKEKLLKENNELSDRVEILIGEKAELQSKLDQYLQENMELIDKLEKMSTEKVSSAESIEIVENLTVQEKLELEEYQKNLDPQSGKLKMSEEHLEENPDLNDSVNRLTEETSELLQKIELFTVERREVMEKMESLSTENSHLLLKLKQVENNSELLTETYEQLQSEKEILNEKLNSLQKENEQLKQKIDAMKNEYNINEFDNLQKKLFDLEGEYIKLGEDKKNLQKELKLQSELVFEKNQLELQLKEANDKILQFEMKLTENLEEIRTYQTVIEENKEELIRSASQINELKEIIVTKETEMKACESVIENLNLTISKFNEKVDKLEDECESGKRHETTIEDMEKQLESLKKVLDENLGQIADYENELEENSNLIKQLNQQMKELRTKNLELQKISDSKNEEQEKTIAKLHREIEELQSQIISKDEMFHKVSGDMKDKFLSLQKQTDINTVSLDDMREPLQKKIEELTTKNDALVVKMKKIAANLKKKTQNCQELEHQFNTSKEKWESELNEKNLCIRESELEINKLKMERELYQTEINELKLLIEEKKENLLSQSSPVKSEMSISLHDELLGSNFVQETFPQQCDDTKIKELELIVETQQNDLYAYKERISQLEEMLSKMDETRETLEQKTNELGVQLAEKSQSFEEISKTEDLLEQKLTNLSKHNEEIEKKLTEVSASNEKLSKENTKLRESAKKIKQKLIISQERVNELLVIKENASQMEEELNKTRSQITNLEQDVRKLELERVQLQELAKSDLEKLDNDWQMQFDSLAKEKSELSILCEKLNERIAELEESENILSDKVRDLESKLEKSFELQESSDFELTSNGKEIRALKDEVEKKNEEIDNHIIEIRNLQSTKQIELNVVNELKRENEYFKEQVNELSQQLNSHQCRLEDARKEVDELKSINEKLKTEVPESSKHEESQGTKPLFSWTDQEKDPFSFVEQQIVPVFEQPFDSSDTVQVQKEGMQQETSSSKNSEEELLQKIKTLEFMLKNVENEREELMNQCSHLSNELMSMVYQHGQNPMTEQVTGKLLSTQETAQTLEPVNEPLFEKKEAYLCFPEDKVEGTDILHSIESQVVAEELIEPSSGELQTIEFTKTRDITDSTNPFLEEPIQKKEAYLCYPDDAVAPFVSSELSKPLESNPDQINIDPFGENDDGWGWNPEEAKQEELENQKYEANHLKIIELEDKIKAMEMERENKQKEYQELQVKSGKLIKKLKELKVQNETLKKSKKEDDNDMFNLESAIQEELKTQIETLERRISEVTNELSKEKNEKQMLQKKLESLTSSNQKMLEMKEKQNIEMLMLERKSQELKSKLDQFEWGEGESTPEKSINPANSDKVSESDILKMQATVVELNETIRELTLDNEELQTLLEEQRSLRITAEKAKSVEPIPENMKAESEYLDIVNQKQILEVELDKVLSEKNNLNEELNRILSVMKTEEEFKELISQKQEIEEKLEKITQENERLQRELNELITSMRSEEEFEDITKQKLILEDELTEIKTKKKKLQDDFNQIMQRNDEQNKEFAKLLEEKLQLEKMIEEKDIIMKELMLNSDRSDLQINELNELNREKAQSELKVQKLQDRINELERDQNDILSRVESEMEVKNSTIISLEIEKENLLKDLNRKENEIENIKLKIDDESSSLKTEVDTQIKNIEHLIQENQELTSRHKQLELQIETLSQQLETKDSEYQIQIGQLSQDWQILVDQRGSDVAESWKLHLDMRETEFGQLEQQLRKEINDLEERCTSLVNENNELRKNVDTEIRNEVDRISALQQQINDRQQYINELLQTLKDKNLLVENLEQQILQLQSNISGLQTFIEEKEVKLNDLQIIIDTTQKQFNEKRIIVEDIVHILEETSSSPILFDLDSIKTELRRQLGGVIDPDTLSNLQKDLINKDSIISNINKELSAKAEVMANQEREMESFSKEIAQLKQQIENSNVEDEIKSLNDKLKEKEELLLHFEAKMGELEESRQFIERYKFTVEENEKAIKELSDKLAEKEGIISNLTYQLEESQQLRATDDENTQNLQYALQQCRMQCDELRLTLDEKCSLIDVMNAELEKQHSIHVERETNMERLKSYVDELQKSHIHEKDSLESNKNEIIAAQDLELNNLRNQLGQSHEALRMEKEAAQESINYLQSQIQEQDKNIMELSSQIESYRKLNDELGKNLNELEELRKKYDEQNILLNEEEKQMDELKAIIENQVVKIEDLKQKLYEKSNDYDSLIAELDIRKSDLKVPDPEARAPMGQGRLIGPTSSDDLNEWVTRSELDIALYMLHQRDVRCEELTVELTQLLEERDTLQLRLSNALREKEDYRRVVADEGKISDTISEDPKSSPTKGAIPKDIVGASGAEVATEAQESLNTSEYRLENKLSQLKNIGYKRDKTLLDEQQQRRLQQLSIMQQHMDEASKLPPEAAARLVDANYTLSRDVQSPSKVLLNWLWGRSTPKVNDL